MKRVLLLGVFLFGFIAISQEQQKPNILLVIFDDAGMDMSAYGESYVDSPGFDAVAEQGILFNKTYTPNAKCSPSRASILTGRNSWQLDAGANHYIYFPPKFKTFPEVMLENGYATGYTGKGYVPGVTLTSDGKERQVIGQRISEFQKEVPTSEISATDYAANFNYFVNEVAKGQPWFFWVGFHEPHRAYEYGSGEKVGKKKLSDIKHVPKYWPDTTIVRHDLLDYALEVEYADSHLQQILKYLEDSGELENTLVIVTSDHGMPFPRVKGNGYEHANHIPMTMMWKDKIKEKRVVDDYISFIDLAPTIMDIAGIDWQSSGMHPATGTSLRNILFSKESGQIEASRDYVLIGKERHDPGRPNDEGYPFRGMYKDDMLYIKNYEPDRWPAGNPETGYLNVDSSPIKRLLIEQRRDGIYDYWKLNLGKRPIEELYDISKDPDCVRNLAEIPALQNSKKSMETEMENMLLEQGDLRMIGYGHLYESHPFYKVGGVYNRFEKGEALNVRWVDERDIENFYLSGDGEELRKIEFPARKSE
nr:sulfatase [Allomuricauda sp.]